MNPSSTTAAGLSPTSLGGQSTSMMQAGGAIQGIGSIFGGIAGFAQAQYQAQVAKINAQIMKRNEDNALIKGEADALHYGIQASQRMGAIRAAQGASGLDVNSGSARDVQVSQDKIAHLDMQQIRENAARVAYDYNAQMVGFENQARLDRMSGFNSLIAGGLGAASSFVGSSNMVASKWYAGNQAGLGAPQPTAAKPNDNSVILGGIGVDSVISGSTWGN